MKRIAIQGIRGSFHDIAVHQYFPDEELELVCCNSFDELITTMQQDDSVIGFMAIENTIAGSLLHNYELLRNSGATIIGEHKLHIEHSLMCLPDEKMENIREINSHPVALAQCRQFLNLHPHIKVVEVDDTAGAARNIREKQLRGHAAICHEGAAPLYGMKVLKRSIEDNKHNFTRFLVLSDAWFADQLRDLHQTNKSSIVFTLPHEEGSLSQVLSIFNFYKINLTKIQSLPIIGQEWEYMFYVDITYNDYFRYRQSIDAVKPLTSALKILGEYQGK
ncbi:chorismate mutase/prephenate dehydratase [gut metagenome]|uniref:Chorismate mutase/prephenate dehydratase n=1 Tax=gut metagenome TaxID=749906 RepID=J9GIM5_9ZZZZ